MAGELETAAIRTIASLGLVVGLIVCLFYALRKWRFGALAPNKQAAMRLIGTLSLAPRRSLALVEIDDQWLVVGVGADQVTLITKLERPTEPDRQVALDPPEGIRGRWQRKMQRASGTTNESAQ
jgi:flagellar biosynthetic protein FliO